MMYNLDIENFADKTALLNGGFLMALTRKVLRGILEAFKAEGGDVEQAMDSILSEHGATIRDYKTRLEKFDDIDLEALKSDKEALKGIRDKLGNTSLDDLLSEHTRLADTLKGKKLEDILSENARYAEKEAKAIKDAAIDELVKGYKFTSAAAERDIRGQISALPMDKEGKAFVDADKIMPDLVAKNADAFRSDVKPPMFSSAGTKAGSNVQDEQSEFIRKHYGLK